MARVPISSQIAAQIRSRIAAFPTEAPETLQWLSPYTKQFGALPLYPGWIETIGIRPDGEIVCWSTEGDFAGTRPVDERSWVLLALVAGAERYSELRPLLPVRGPDAVDCLCRAVPIVVSGQVRCGRCGGLGWLPGLEC